MNAHFKHSKQKSLPDLRVWIKIVDNCFSYFKFDTSFFLPIFLAVSERRNERDEKRNWWRVEKKRNFVWSFESIQGMLNTYGCIWRALFDVCLIFLCPMITSGGLQMWEARVRVNQMSSLVEHSQYASPCNLSHTQISALSRGEMSVVTKARNWILASVSAIKVPIIFFFLCEDRKCKWCHIRLFLFLCF